MADLDETKNYYSTQNTLRLSQDELDYIQENYRDVTGEDEKISINKFFMKAVTQAVSNVKPKTIEKDNPEHIKKLDEQAEIIKGLSLRIEELENTKPTGLVLEFNKDWKKYIWGILEISKKDNYAKTYEELFMKMFQILNARKELLLDEKDLEYLKTLEYVE